MKEASKRRVQLVPELAGFINCFEGKPQEYTFLGETLCCEYDEVNLDDFQA